MLDPKLIRHDPQQVAKQLQARGFTLDISFLEKKEEQRKSLQTDVQSAQAERNKIAKSIGMAKGKGEPVDELMAQSKQVADQLADKEQQLSALQKEIEDFMLTVPNIPHESVPQGKDENDNQEVSRWGEPKKFDFTPKQHFELSFQTGAMDFEAANRLSGARFVVLQNHMARLHRSLAQFMLDFHLENHGYQEVYVPYLLKPDCLQGTGQLPKMAEDIFMTQDGELCLLPTAEVPVTNLVREQIVKADDLPLKFVCHSPCFRREAGSYGKDTRGMLRQHQFDKVELVWVEHPDKSYEALESLTSHAEAILQALELPYRKIVLCSGDIGFSATKTYDLEVWMPGQDCYREISSCSNTESFQARRMQARFKADKKPQLVHTLNGSGIAVGRAMIAVLENYQDQAGNVHIPKVLQPYMGGITVLEPSA